MSKVFISYSSSDKPWVSKLANELTNQGYDIWWDLKLLPGQHFEEVIRAALDNAECVVTVWSESSLRSVWVQEESSKALERGVLIPILYQKITPPMPFGRIHTGDLTKWNGKSDDPAFQQLLQSIRLHSKSEVISVPQSPKEEKTSTKLIPILVFSILLLSALMFFRGDSPSVLNEALEERSEAQTAENTIEENIREVPKTKGKKWQAINHYQVKDGLVKDTKTGLMWMRCAIGNDWAGSSCPNKSPPKMSIWNALSVAKKSQYQGYNDWRLPTEKELLSLVYCNTSLPKKWNNSGTNCQGNFKQPTVNQQVFPYSHGGYYSSFPYVTDKSKPSWKIHFLHGGNYDSNYNKVYDFPLRLVRKY